MGDVWLWLEGWFDAEVASALARLATGVVRARLDLKQGRGNMAETTQRQGEGNAQAQMKAKIRLRRQQTKWRARRQVR